MHRFTLTECNIKKMPPNKFAPKEYFAPEKKYKKCQFPEVEGLPEGQGPHNAPKRRVQQVPLLPE